jgi:hypothetical protein
MAEEFAPPDFRFLFVYAREAHPSDRFPAHTSLEGKLGHARRMRERLQMKRPMLVDDLEGTVHHAYGRLPNMTYILKPGGTIVYRASWTDPTTIRLALERILFERDERRAQRRTTPYYLEWQPQRSNDRIAFVQGLLEIGERAVEEYIAAVENTEGEAGARRLKDWWHRRKSE